jgi:hypothetical protein
LWAFVTSDAFTLVIFLLVASGTADTIYGRRIHKQLHTYEQHKAEIGLLSKIMGIVLTMLIRGFEGWWSTLVMSTPFDGWHTNGFLAMAVAVTLFVHDLKSIQEKRVRFGQPPLPVFTQVLAVLDGLASLLGAGPPDNRRLVERRSTDPPDDTSYARRTTDHKIKEDE